MTATANMIKQARGEPTLPHVRNAGLAAGGRAGGWRRVH
jgi:hypothetical protein